MHESASGQMASRGYYDRHSLSQHAAGGLGLPLLGRAVSVLRIPDPRTGPAVVADYGAAGGRNELAPMNAAIDGLRARGVAGPISVVHTDIPSNDFTALFNNLDNHPETYLRNPNVFAFAAGRSFYQQIFPPGAVCLGWSAIAVHWLSRVPLPIADHVYCSFASGESRRQLAAQSANDWMSFLYARAAEMGTGAQLVVVGGAASDDGSSGAEALMSALNEALRQAVVQHIISDVDYRRMTIPTWNRKLSEFRAPFSPGGLATEAGLALEESSLEEIPDHYLHTYLASGDAMKFADDTTSFLRAFTEPSLIGTLGRAPSERKAISDAVYTTVRRNIAADPGHFETRWRVALLRISKLSASSHDQ